MRLAIQGMPTAHAEHLRHGGADANGQAPLRERAEGTGNPCRHCLQQIADGDDKLVLSYRPFTGLQPYAESGPIFLHARDCERYTGDALPAWFAFMAPALVRGYDRRDWIVYATGSVVDGRELEAACRRILANDAVAYVHIRSKFNCFQCRVERG